MTEQWKAAAARIFTTRRLRFVSFIAPFFYIASYLLFYTLDHSWPWLVVAILFFAVTIAATRTRRYRANQPPIPVETDELDDVPSDSDKTR